MISDVSKHQVFPRKYLTKIKVPVLFRRSSCHFTKYGEFQPFSGFGAQKCSFGPKMGLGRPRRKTSDKRKVLGAFLEAPRRKSWFWGPKTEKMQFSLKFRRKSIFGAKSAEIAKWRKTSQNLTFFALKTCLKRHILLFWGPKAPKTPKWGEFHGLSWNVMKFSKMLVFSRSFSILGKRGAQSRNGSQIPMKTTRNTWCFGIAPRARPVFMKMLRNHKNQWKSWFSWNFIKFSGIHDF